MRLLVQIREWGDNDRLRGFAGLEPFPDGSYARLSNEYMFHYGLFALTYYDTAQVQPSFNQAIDDLLAYKWNGFFEQLALGMDGYDTELMFQSYQDQEPYDPHGYTRGNLFEINGDGQRHRPRSARHSKRKPNKQRWTARSRLPPPSFGVSPTTRATSRTTTTMAEISGRGQPSVTLTSPTRRTAPLHARTYRESPSW